MFRKSKTEINPSYIKGYLRHKKETAEKIEQLKKKVDEEHENIRSKEEFDEARRGESKAGTFWRNNLDRINYWRRQWLNYL